MKLQESDDKSAGAGRDVEDLEELYARSSSVNLS